ncbi:MAG: tRNA (adenosine(37)-N6)-threonylcarbamoyltransferase complex ATPase subunit type 1 TsaE [Simkaniaceae bacterium]
MILKSLDDTHAFARSFLSRLKPGDILALHGELGAGKTSFVQGLSDNPVTSPTFVYLNIYEAMPPIYHFDLYRLKGPGDFLAMGFDEYFESDGICCMEWPERIDTLLPKKTHHIHLFHEEGNTRRVEVQYGTA